MIIFSKYINREEERMLHINALFWINEMLVNHNQMKAQIEEVLEFLDAKKYEDQYGDL